MCLFGGLSATVALGLHRAQRRYSALALVIVPAAFSTLYGLTDEAHQLFVVSRTFAVGDLIADAFGATLAALLVLSVEGHGRAAGRLEETHRR
jgi:VanZ family protein